MNIAASLRKAVSRRARIIARTDKRIAQLAGRCQHRNVVIVRSAYEGSSGYDYDDAHSEERICLSCGKFEWIHGDGQFTLINPIARMEDNTFNYRMVMSMSMRKLLRYVKQHGYPVIR